MRYLKNNSNNYYVSLNNTSKLVALISYLLLITLSGCTYMNESYDCPLAKTASCISMQEMDRSITKKQVKLSANNKNNIHKVINSINRGEAKIQKNTHLRIWLAPYNDADNNQHDATYVNAVINNINTD